MTTKVECIQASECAVTGKSIFTLLCDYPLDIHAQLLTHGVFSKNSSSCRAIPINTACDNLRANPAKKMWTAKQAGMQGNLITDPTKIDQLNTMHNTFMEHAIANAKCMDNLGVHKQNAGRYLTPFQNIRIVLTSTEWENWDWLRNDKDAQPEIRDLAEKMIEARDNAQIMTLNAGEYHVPFVARNRNVAGKLQYFREEENGHFTELTLKNAIELSQSCCAQVSYRKNNTSAEKTEDIIGKLFSGHKVHASPTEHQATPLPARFHGPVPNMSLQDIMESLPDGVTAIDRRLQFRSGNFINWIQQRQLIEGHDYAETLRDSEDNNVFLDAFFNAIFDQTDE